MKIELELWKKNNPIKETMYFRNAALSQFNEIEQSALRCNINVFVVGTHTSKSILLPVYLLQNKDASRQLWVRDNFHNYAISIQTEKPIQLDSSVAEEEKGMGDNVFSCYFEGFERNNLPIFTSYKDCSLHWSAHIYKSENMVKIISAVFMTK